MTKIRQKTTLTIDPERHPHVWKFVQSLPRSASVIAEIMAKLEGFLSGEQTDPGAGVSAWVDGYIGTHPEGRDTAVRMLLSVGAAVLSNKGYVGEAVPEPDGNTALDVLDSTLDAISAGYDF